LDILVELKNEGSSDAIGGVYLSGYSPETIEEENTILERVPSVDCGLNGVSIGDGGWWTSFACDFGDILDIHGQGGSGGLGGLGGLVNVGEIFEWAGITDYFTRDGNELMVEIDYDGDTGQTAVGIDVDLDALSVGYYNHGRNAILQFSTFYQTNFGRNFISEVHGGREFSRGVLLGDNPWYPGGEIDYVDFKVRVKNWPTGLDEMPQFFQLTSCYLYTTYADPIICVDPYPEGPGRKVCRPQTISYTKGQGAPVALTKVEQETTPYEIFFTFHFENKGKGIVWSPWSLHKCDPYYGDERVKPTDTNRLFIGDIRFAGELQQLECVPSDRILRLDENGRGQIKCSYPIKYVTRDAYQSPLIVEAWYGYSDTVLTQTRIKRVR